MTIAAPSSRLRSRLSEFRSWHLISLAVSVIVLGIAARNLWFFSDEWDFLIPSNDAFIFAPHVGHWSTTPILVTQTLRDIFGIDSYWPFIAVSMAVHLLLCHVLWRIMLRVGVNGWIATALASLMMLLGAGAENILWGFQFGFMGAILVGLVVVLLVDVEKVSVRRWILIELLAIWSLTFSGTAIPVIVAASIVGFRRHGLRRTVVQFLPVAIIYGLWYLRFAIGHVISYGPTNVAQLGLGVPNFIVHEFVDGLGALFPYSLIGIVVVFCLIAWVVHSFPLWRGPATPAFALAVAAIVQTTLTALTRVNLGVDTAASGRYIYVLVALLLPLIGLALTWFAHNVRSATAIVVALVLVVALFNTIVLARQAVAYTEMEQSSKARVSAALSLVFKDHVKVAGILKPSPNYAGELDMANLEEMYRRGWVHIGSFDDVARLSVLTNLRIAISSASAPASRSDCQAVRSGVAYTGTTSSRPLLVYTAKDITGGMSLSDGTSVGDTKPIALNKGWSKIESGAHGETISVTLGGATTVCAG